MNMQLWEARYMIEEVISIPQEMFAKARSTKEESGSTWLLAGEIVDSELSCADLRWVRRPLTFLRI